MSGELYIIRITPNGMLGARWSAVIVMLAQVISGLLAAVYELDIRCAQLDTLACTITTHILSMVDSSKSDAHDEGYVIDELGVMAPPASVPTENRTSSSPLLVSAGMFTGQSGIMSSQSPVPEATDAVTPQNEPRDPQVASLRSIFPDYDEAILCVFDGFSFTDGLTFRLFTHFCLHFLRNAGPMDVLASFWFVCELWTVNQSWNR